MSAQSRKSKGTSDEKATDAEKQDLLPRDEEEAGRGQSIKSLPELKAWLVNLRKTHSGEDFFKRFPDTVVKAAKPDTRSGEYQRFKAQEFVWVYRMFHRLMATSALVVPSIINLVLPNTYASGVTYYLQSLSIPASSLNDLSNFSVNLALVMFGGIATAVTLIDNLAAYPYVIAGFAQQAMTAFYFFESSGRDLTQAHPYSASTFFFPCLVSAITSCIMLAAVWILGSQTSKFEYAIAFTGCFGLVILCTLVSLCVSRGNDEQSANIEILGSTFALLIDTIFLTLLTDTNATTAFAALTNTGTSTTAFTLVLALLGQLYTDKNLLSLSRIRLARMNKVTYILAAFNVVMDEHIVLAATIGDSTWKIILNQETPLPGSSDGPRPDPNPLEYIDSDKVGAWFAALLVNELNFVALPDTPSPEDQKARAWSRLQRFGLVMHGISLALDVREISRSGVKTENGYPLFNYLLEDGATLLGSEPLVRFLLIEEAYEAPDGRYPGRVTNSEVRLILYNLKNNLEEGSKSVAMTGPARTQFQLITNMLTFLLSIFAWTLTPDKVKITFLEPEDVLVWKKSLLLV